MNIPSWADTDVSKLIPQIRAGGEGQHVEFIVDFSDQAREIAKEVAAFATSRGGKVLLGVRDDGTVAGLNANDHDMILQRVQGILRSVQPHAAYSLHLCYDGGFILLIDVAAKQDKPVYCCEYRVYVRDFRTSRPATVDEIIDCVWSHPSSEQKKRMEVLSFEMARRHAEQTDKQIAEWDALALRSSMAQHEMLAQARQSFLDRQR